jgi:Holliday junction resolvase-like predicted endonuclease
MSDFPDFERLSHSEPNVQTKVLGVLLGDDYRSCFLPHFLDHAGLGSRADWTCPDCQAIFFTRPLRAYLRDQTADPTDANQAQGIINGFLGLPPTFALRRNTDGKLTHPRGWNSRFIARMLDDNLEHVTRLGRDQCESKLWLMEEVANTEVDLILQSRATIIFCEVKWLSGPGRASQKPALKEYDLDQLARQYLAGLFLDKPASCTVYHLLLDRLLAADQTEKRDLGRLRELVPSAGECYVLHHAYWQDVYEVATECLLPEHSLLAYMRDKLGCRDKTVVSLA